jgi:curved DNA-binding protein CbpA
MTQRSFDPYRTLGIPREASARQVRDAYRRLARRHHPDVADDRQATERMQRINRAWQTLSSPDRRARYDTDLAATSSRPGHWSGARRQAARWSAVPPSWSAGTTTAYRYSQPPPAAYEDEGGPSLLRIVPVVLVLLVVSPILFGVAPIPLYGLLALLAAGWASRRMA